MKEEPYHKYVFDIANRRFVGQFEKMYQMEDRGSYDSWFQDDLSRFENQVSFVILNRYNFDSILDIGCGKGAFTSLLKKSNNRIIGTDISKTAISKAKARFKNGVEFFRATTMEALDIPGEWDLIIMKELLSYLENWKEILRKAAGKTEYVYISLHIPPNPIGFVKTFGELKKWVSKYFYIETELFWRNDWKIFLLGKNRWGKVDNAI